MDLYGADAFGASLRQLSVDAYTAGYRVSGQLRTRFSRVADMLNQQSGTHLILEQATVSEYAAADSALGAQQALVNLREILLFVAAEADGSSQSEMRIPKRRVRAQLAIPPFRVTGVVHVPQGSRPADGLLNLGERFMPMTEAAIQSAAHPDLDRTVDAVAICRDAAHVMLVTDDERPDELLADVLDRRTAESWLRTPAEEGR